MTRLAWWSCPSGISGDMALGALVAAGAPLAAMQSAIDALATEPVELRAGLVTRGGVRATRVEVIAPAAYRPRRWPDIRAILETADLAPPVRATALETFRRLAGAEAEAHGTHPDDVHFHEVGALDALADVVGAAAGLAALGIVGSGCSCLALGGGTATGAHGPLPAPGPAVLNLLRAAGARLVVGGPAELTTPTGAALLAATVTGWGDSPPMVVLAHGFGAGSRDLPDRANVAGLVIAEAEPRSRPEGWLVVEANVDDLDPRLWPGVLAEVLRAGAADAWLTPVLMKKGRPAHTVHVLCPAALAGEIRRVLYRDTSTIGTRSFPVAKDELPREVVEVLVDGQPVRVKVSRLGSGPPTATPEFDDVALAAEKLGRSARDVLAEAAAAARAISGGAPPR
jgi:uncharacterized protein (TIGR00299 family) protein